MQNQLIESVLLFYRKEKEETDVNQWHSSTSELYKKLRKRRP